MLLVLGEDLCRQYYGFMVLWSNRRIGNLQTRYAIQVLTEHFASGVCVGLTDILMESFKLTRLLRPTHIINLFS